MKKQKNETVTLGKGGKSIHLDYSDLRKAVLVLRAVNHKLRQRIIDLLEENDSMTVTDIYIKLRLEQSVASQHLAILRRAGVVLTERQGKFIYYSLDKERLAQISRLVEELADGGYFVEEQNSSVLWVLKDGEVLYKNILPSQHEGHHHLANWARVIP